MGPRTKSARGVGPVKGTRGWAKRAGVRGGERVGSKKNGGAPRRRKRPTKNDDTILSGPTKIDEAGLYVKKTFYGVMENSAVGMSEKRRLSRS